MNSFDDFINEIEKAQRKTTDIIYDEFFNVGVECVGEIKFIEPVKTGALRRSITTGEIEFENNEYKMMVGSSLAYAKAVEEGHMQEVGKYIPTLGKKLKKSFIQGNHAIGDTVQIYQPKLIERIKERVESEV